MNTTVKKVLFTLKKIPKGKVTTYGALAKKFNTSARAVGQIMRGNPWPGECPCYKVVKSDGTLGGYVGKVKGKEIAKKIRLLRNDGVNIENWKIDRKYFWEFT